MNRKNRRDIVFTTVSKLSEEFSFHELYQAINDIDPKVKVTKGELRQLTRGLVEREVKYGKTVYKKRKTL